MTESTTPKIEILIEREARMQAITAMANALESLAKALNAQPEVTISDCHIQSSDIGISISTQGPEVFDKQHIDLA
jgi:hypothetical protein